MFLLVSTVLKSSAYPTDSLEFLSFLIEKYPDIYSQISSFH